MSTRTTQPGLDCVTWLGMSLSMPADWEILQHATRSQRGKLVFADRRRGRMYLGWATAKISPDRDRLLEDYRARDLEEDADTRFSSLGALGGWRGYRRQRGQEIVTRAGRFDDIHLRWLELTIAWPDGVDRPLERAILESFILHDDRRGPTTWRAFGITCKAPEGLVLRGAEVRPGSAMLRFTDDRRLRTEAELRRFKAVEAWYDGDAQTLIEKQLPRSDWTFERQPLGRVSAVIGRTQQPAPQWRNLVGLRRRRVDMVWPDESGRRLLHVTTISPPSRPLEPTAFGLEVVEPAAATAQHGVPRIASRVAPDNRPVIAPGNAPGNAS
jgi:hypothetical protein